MACPTRYVRVLLHCTPSLIAASLANMAMCMPPIALDQDPLADGPVIQGAATRSLAKGTTLDVVINMVASTSPSIKAPLVLFTYYNPIMRRGADKFCRQIKAAGASGERARVGLGFRV